MKNSILFFFFFSFFFPPFSYNNLSAQTGPNTPVTSVNDNSYGIVAWTNPGAINTSDNFYANSTGLTMGQPTQYLKATNLGFAINPCDDINGIEVRVEWSQTGTSISQDRVNLVVNNTILTAVNKSTGVALPNPADQVTLFGGITDTWGQTLKGVDVNNTGFGVAISAIRLGGGAASTPQIDHITITLYHSTPPAMTYNSSTVSQVTNVLNPNTSNNPIIRVDVISNSGCPPIDATSFTFNMNGTTDLADIQNAKLYYTGSNPAFNTASQLGSTLAVIPGGNFDINSFSQSLISGTNYFWLAVDVVPGAIIGNFVDGECPSFILDAVGRTPALTAPAGNREIVAPITFTVGSSGETYTTIQAAYNAIPASPANAYIIEIYSDYNSTLETFPISFANKSNSYNIIVRPAFGESGVICAGTIGSQGLWEMNNAQNIVIEGRPGSLGIIKEFTVRNTKISAPYGTAFRIINDAKNITFNFLNIEAETTTGTALDGIITIGTSTGTNGNDEISVLNCLLRDLSVGGSGVVPTSGVYSNGTPAKTNDFITVSNCQFSQGGFPAIDIFANSGRATITDNHMFYPGGMTISTAAQGINITSGSDHTVSGNFIGGTAANCGGAVFSIASGSVNVTGIFINASGNNIIENNTIGNIRYTTTYNLTSFPLVGISVNGSGNYTIGSSGNGNLIGSMTGTANFRLTHNGTSGEGIAGIINNSTGTVSVAYNNIGALTQDGTFAGADAVMILSTSSSGFVTIDNNIIGSSSAGDNILMSSNSNFFGISNTGSAGITCTNNTIKYVSYLVLSATSMYGISNTAGSLTCSGNILKNLTSNNLQYIINHSGTTAAFSSNTIQDISETGVASTASFYGIYLNTASSVTCNSNIIGSAIAGNISLSSNAISSGIWNNSTGTLLADGNTIRNFLLNNGGATTQFVGIFAAGGILNATNNTVADVSVSSTRVGGSGISGIASQSSSVGQVIEKNSIKNLFQTNTSFTSTSAGAIIINAGTGNIRKNYIYNISNAITDNTAILRGIDIIGGNWEISNNVVIINNDVNTNDIIVYGIKTSSTGNVNTYHNTIVISGSVTAGTAPSTCFFRNNTGICITQNNIFQNKRTGGTGGHFAEYASTVASYTTDYNFLEVLENQSNTGNWNGTSYNFIDWQTNSGAINDLNGTVFPDANGRIITCFAGANKGTNLLGTVNDDKEDNPRDGSPCLGAFETNSSPWDYYWVGGNGTWTDLTHWGCQSGGTGGVSIPTINDNVYIDNNSGSVTITIPSGTYYTKGFFMSGSGATSTFIGQGVLLPRP